MNHIDILTCQPEILDSPFNNSIIKIAQEKNLVCIKIHNLRHYTEDKHRKVDHSPFGGGIGRPLSLGNNSKNRSDIYNFAISLFLHDICNILSE